MSGIPPLLNARIVAASILNNTAPPIPLDVSIPYDGKPLYCHVTNVGSQLVVSVNDTPSSTLDPIAANCTTAVVDVSYAGSAPGRIAAHPIEYGHNGFIFYLRLDFTHQNAAIYLVEKSIAMLEEIESEQTAGSELDTSSAFPAKGRLVFVMIGDGGAEDDPSAPYKLVFLDQHIDVPDYLHKRAALMVGPPDTMGGGIYGPMGIELAP